MISKEEREELRKLATPFGSQRIANTTILRILSTLDQLEADNAAMRAALEHPDSCNCVESDGSRVPCAACLVLADTSPGSELLQRVKRLEDGNQEARRILLQMDCECAGEGVEICYRCEALASLKGGGK